MSGNGTHVLGSYSMIHNVRRETEETKILIMNIRKEINIMSKIAKFFKESWNEYVDFMGKYGQYMYRN